MNRKIIEVLPESFPPDIAAFLNESVIYDSSCSTLARVFYIDKDDGYYLKTADSGSLQTEAAMTAYMYRLGISAEVIYYNSHGDKDYLITKKIPGEDCTYPDYKYAPEKLCDTTAALLRELHDMRAENCPVKDRIRTYVNAVTAGITNRHYESDLFKGLWEFSSFDEAKQEAENGIPYLKREVLLHGDYCLPNIILNDWKFSGFIDVGNGGIGDRHIDILWGIWTLKYNLRTSQYTQRFIDAYGRENVEYDKLRSIAAMEMIGG